MPQTPRVNCHVHIFNLEVMKTSWALDVLRKRMEFDFKDSNPKLGELLGDLAVKVVSELPDLNEENLLSRILKRLDRDAEIPDFVREPALRGLRRLVDRLLERLRKDPDSDFRDEDLHDILEMVRIMAKPSIAAVTDWLMGQVGPDDAVVPLMQDLTDGESDVTDLEPGQPSRFRRQLDATSEVILSYPGRVLPFVGVHTARHDHLQLIEEGLGLRNPDDIGLGFVGVKLYPSLGYETDTPEMRAIYRICEQGEIPLLMHTNTGGFVGREGANLFPDPAIWRDSILKDFPNLKICFAHFGGGGRLALPFAPGDDPTRVPEVQGKPNWGQTIIDLILDPRYPNIYADVAFHRKPMDSDAEAANYFARLAAMLDHPVLGRSILFGTDFWLIRPRLRESSHWRFFEDNLARQPGDDIAQRFDRLARRNAALFLGLPGGGGANAAIGKHIDFVTHKIVEERADVKRPPLPWLLEAIGKQHGEVTRREVERLTEDLRPERRLLGASWPELLEGVAGKTVGDPFEEDFEVDLDRVTTHVLGATVGFEGSGEIRVRTFTDPAERDDDALLLPPPVDANFSDYERQRIERQRGESRRGTPIPYRDDRAWTKYRVEGRVRADAEAASGLASLGISAEKSVVFTDYRAHAPATELASALESDLRRPRFALDRNDVLAMQDGDGVSFATRGQLGGELTLTWQDIFTSGLGTLAEELGTQAPLRLRVDLGATLSARLEVVDDFRVVFTRRTEEVTVGDRLHRVDKIRVVARKLESRDRAFTAEIGATLQFEDPDALVEAFDQLLEQRFGIDMTKVQALLDQGAPADAEDRELLADLEDKLAEQDFEAVRDAIEAWRSRLRSAVEKIAHRQLRAGFAYHYNRLETNAVLLEADLSEDALEQLHHEIVDGDFSGLLARHRSGDLANVDLHQFLRFQEIVKRRAWGFHLGPIGGQDHRERRFRTHVLVPDGDLSRKESRLSFLGLRGYSGSWPKALGGNTTWGWQVDFRAEMDDFKPQPKATDFKVGLALSFEWSGRFFKRSLSEWLDAAKLWRAVREPVSRDATWESLPELHKEEVEVRLQMVLDPLVLDALLPKLAEVDLTHMGKILAEAMPLRDAEARRTLSDRRRAFGDLWSTLLSSEAAHTGHGMGSGILPREWARQAAQELREAGLHNAARAEQPDPDSNDHWQLWTFGGLLAINGSPTENVELFLRGLKSLANLRRPTDTSGHEAPSTAKAADEIVKIFADLEALWKQSHHVRAAGALLAAIAEKEGHLSKVRSSLTFRHAEDDPGRGVVVGVPA